MVRAHRDRLRAKGLRPVQFWLPDVRTPDFKAEAARQSRAVAAGAEEADVTAFLEAATDWGDEP
jgi:hypothetical protein